MDRWIAVVVMALAGGVVAIQPALNAGLGRATGGLPAAMFSFFLGGAALLLVVLAAGQIGQLSELGEVPWFYLLGGLCGALWVSVSLVAVTSIGAGSVVAATITGQLTGAVIADRLGILGLDQVPITVGRVVGVLLLALGTYMVVR